MAKEYDHKTIDAKWQKKWLEGGDWRAEDDSAKPKFYPLIEFPYPSGAGLHIGHPRPYVGLDLIARKKRRDGFNVLYPIGWDAFGLPTENYALKTGKDPRLVTEENTNTFRRQIQSLGISFDWSREINTTDPKYYKWTQWIFLQLYKHGLAYKGKATINWCPKDKIGLANEEVVDGKCERCGTEVEKREKEQWMLAITKYAQRLHDDLDTVDYIERAKTQQKNWIGPSEGLVFSSPVKDSHLVLETFSAHFEAFFADTFVVIAPDHPFLPELLQGTTKNEEVMAAAKEMLRKRGNSREEIKEVEGVFTGRYVIDPVGNGELPIWIANYALADYGTGIVKCSAHDERDFAFAKKYGIRLKPVLFPEDAALKAKVEAQEICFTDMKGGVLAEPLQFAGKRAGEHRQAIADFAVEKQFAVTKTTFKLRDWVFSRQRYWGEPIPMIHCETCGWQPVPESELPVELPKVEKYQPTDTGESPLALITDWVKTSCPKCKGEAKRETDVMPNWAGSSWYYLRYTDPKNDVAVADKKKLAYFTPVDWYNGGMEHTVLHLLYSRFWHKFLFDIGVVPTNEPYAKRTSHGVILAEDGTKMSKSKGNVINPDDMVERVGADALRVYEMFMGPFDQAIAWSFDGLVGARKFLERVAGLLEKTHDSAVSAETELLLNQTIKKVGDDIEAMKFNTAVSQLMILSNELGKLPKVPRKAYEILIALLAPFAPHLAEELWHELGNSESIHRAPWPAYDASKLRGETDTIAVQIGGKTRGTVLVPQGVSLEGTIKIVLADPKLGKLVPDNRSKEIYVPGRIINFIP